MTRIINILATESVENAFVRQPIEFYLAHKILENPLAYWKAKSGHSYKIVDCSACELGMGIDMKKVIEAARYISASEIVLPDVVKDDNSIDVSLHALSTLNNKQLNEFKIAIVIQGSTLQTALQTVEKLCKDHDAMVLIDTIMIPKWFTTSARIALTKKVRELAPQKAIHWLGLGDDISFCINSAKRLNIRSLDTGYFLSVGQERMTNVIKSNRIKEHCIDLEHNKLKSWQISEIIEAVNTYHFNPNINTTCRVVEDMKDREFAGSILRAAFVGFTLLILALVFIKFMH